MSHALFGGCASPYNGSVTVFGPRNTWKYIYSPSLDEAFNAQVIVVRRSPDQGTKRSEDKSPASPGIDAGANSGVDMVSRPTYGALNFFHWPNNCH